MGFSVNEMVKIDESVVEKYHKKMINNLHKRGWSIYNTGLNEEGLYRFSSEEEIKICIEAGREKTFMDKHFTYTILPYVEEDSNWDKVREAMIECIRLKRYPFWVDLETYDEDGQDRTMQRGVYLIDSIVFHEDEADWEFVVDYNLMDQVSIIVERKDSVRLGLMYTNKVLKQMTKCVK